MDQSATLQSCHFSGMANLQHWIFLRCLTCPFNAYREKWINISYFRNELVQWWHFWTALMDEIYVRTFLFLIILLNILLQVNIIKFKEHCFIIGLIWSIYLPVSLVLCSILVVLQLLSRKDLQIQVKKLSCS